MYSYIFDRSYVFIITFLVPKLSNLLSNTCALVSSGFLSLLMLYKLFILNDDIPLTFKFNTNIPFLSFNFNIDNLAAFFILIITVVCFVVSLFSYTYMSHYFYRRNVAVFGLLLQPFYIINDSFSRK